MSNSIENFEPVENAITVNLPPFGTANPRVWFTQVEASFRCRRITSQTTMFSYVTAILPNDIATEVIDVLDPMPTEEPYDKLKSAILKRTTVSDEARLQHLLSGIELGDRTPSQLLRHMRSLAGNFKINDTILRQLWCKCLPPNTNAILSTQEEGASLDKLAEMADKIHECFFKTTTGTVNMVTQENQPTSLLQTIADRMSRLELTVAAISNSSRQGRTPSRSTSRHRPYRGVSKTEHDINPTCKYHYRFGHKARKCTSPCNYRQRHNLAQGNAPASQ